MSETTPAVASTDAAMTEYVNPDQMKMDIAIDVTSLSADMQRHASLYVDYATKAVRARRQYERFKAVQEVMEAQLDGEYRTSLKEANPKTTEGQIRAAVVTDPRWRATSARVIDAQQLYRLADVAVSGFDQRKDMLLQIARDAAREGAGQLRVVASADSKDRLLASMEKNVAAA